MGSQKKRQVKDCPRCHQEPSIRHSNYGILPGLKCQKKDDDIRRGAEPEFYVPSKQDRIQRQRDKHAKDILQPWAGDKPNPEFVKAYPKELDRFYSKEDIAKL